MLATLEDADGIVRSAALEALGKLSPEVLATHACAVLARLEDANWGVRRAALDTLGKLSPEVLATHACAVLTRLEDAYGKVRKAALEALGKLTPEVLATHAGAVIARLEDADSDVRRAALEALGKLSPEVLATHAGAVIARLEDVDSHVRKAALETLGKLSPEKLLNVTEPLTSISVADAERIIAALPGFHWRCHESGSADDGVAISVEAVRIETESGDWREELRWSYDQAQQKSVQITTSATLISSGGQWVVGVTFDEAQHVATIDWRGGTQPFTWRRLSSTP